MPRFRRTIPPNNKANTKIKTITVSPNNGGNGRGGNGKLTPKQQRFVDEYLKDLNATQACIRAGYSKKTAEVIGCNQLSKVKIQQAVQERRNELQAKAQIDQEGIIKRYMMLTDYHITDFFNDDGTMKPLSEIPKEKLYAIQGFKTEVKKMKLSDEEIVETLIKEFKLSTKRDALDSLARHLGMFEKDNAQQGGGGKFNFNAPVQINVGWVEEE